MRHALLKKVYFIFSEKLIFRGKNATKMLE